MTRSRHAGRWRIFSGVLILALLTSSAGAAEDPTLDTKSQRAAPTAFAAEEPKPVLSWGTDDGKSYLIPALDIIGFEFLLNQINRHFIDPEGGSSSFSTFKDNLTGGWVYDNDQFSINQFGHPYQGSMYHGFARSAGLGFWPSLGYTVLGSALWETAGEATPPSINDQITTSFGGSFLGEALFRMASLLLESGDGKPGFWGEFGAAAISPSTGFNRLAFGDRFDGVFRSHNPAVYTRVQLGVNLTTTVNSNVNVNRDADEPAIPQDYQPGEAKADFAVAYGLPGKPDYKYERPFDYFHFQFTAATANIFENILTRGLLYGTSYEVGDNYRGVWGLYGTYDYIAPQIFRVSNTAVALGTTWQWWLTRTMALQSTGLAGLGYGSGGTIHAVGNRDYHSGVTPQALLATRLIFGDRAALEMDLRDYYISDVASRESSGEENIARGDVSLTVRVFNLHGITFNYNWSQRDAHYRDLADANQSVGAFGIGYTYLGQTRFGAVDWRPASAGGP